METTSVERNWYSFLEARKFLPKRCFTLATDCNASISERSNFILDHQVWFTTNSSNRIPEVLFLNIANAFLNPVEVLFGVPKQQ